MQELPPKTVDENRALEEILMEIAAKKSRFQKTKTQQDNEVQKLEIASNLGPMNPSLKRK
jgi:hypothetical protein